MKISTKWLQEYFPSSISPEEIGRRLTMKTCEVESVTLVSGHLEDIKVGRVVKVEKHPHSDHLHIAQVDLGKKSLQTIVCGAPNVREGLHVAVILPGSILKTEEEELKIEKREIRGMMSSGMICSEKELGLGEDYSGILELSPKSKIGQSLRSFLKFDDTILEIENKSITHRGDLWSHIGIARECGVIFGKPTTIVEPPIVTSAKRGRLTVTVLDSHACPRYLGVMIDQIKIGPSPKWMQDRLVACGVRPLNVVVDITNYVMLEWGQPLHAFDAQCLESESRSEKEIVVRRAKRAEKIQTLDGVSRSLDSTMLVIADAKTPIGIAGVMGGEHSAISEKTQAIILESAFFDPISIRQTANRLGLRTESSQRFEKRLSPVATELAFRRAVGLLTNLAGGHVASEVMDVQSNVMKKQLRKGMAPIQLSIDWLEQRLGIPISKSKTFSIFNALEFHPKESGNRSVTVIPPHYRPDVRMPEDVLEEIARVYGYENIEETPLPGIVKPVRRLTEHRIEQKLSERLVASGFQEVVRYSFYGDEELQKSGLKKSDHLQLTNALSQDLKYLRMSMLPNLLTALKFNQKRFPRQMLFEIGRVYSKEKEEHRIAGVLMGWEQTFLRLKGVIEQSVKGLHVRLEEDRPQAGDLRDPIINLPIVLQWKIGDKPVGWIGEINPRMLDRFGIKNEVSYFELWTESIAKQWKPDHRIRRIPIFPSVFLDIAIVVSERVTWKELRSTVLKAGQPFWNAELFDVFHASQLGEGKKSLAIHLEFNHPKKTLELAEAEAQKQKILASLKRRFGAQLRS